jgi:hypothetical protein
MGNSGHSQSKKDRLAAVAALSLYLAFDRPPAALQPSGSVTPLISITT